jgi:FixJ family two-component response regulator
MSTSAQSSASPLRTVPVVFVVDADLPVRESLESLIQAAGWEARTFASAKEFLEHPRVMSPGCLIVNMTLPDLHGLQVQKLIADRTGMPVIFISSDSDVSTTVRAMKAGAVEFLTKPLCDDLMLSAIGSAIEHSRAVLRSEVAIGALRQCYASLSPREREVMELVASGWLNKQIGTALGISEITVKAHRGKMIRKMKAASLPALVNMATTLGLTPVPRANGSHLDKIATEGMGLKSNMEHCRLTAHKLLDWRPTLLRRRPEILG